MTRFAIVALIALVGSAQAPHFKVEDKPQDREIFRQKIEWAKSEHLDTLPIGEIIARVGQSFEGSPYVASSLEAPGPEHLVVNLRAFDCVTFVESTLALSRTIRSHGDYTAFENELARIRYRNGKLDGYPSRLHYFSDWIADNQRKGIVTNLTATLGGVRDPEPIDLMTTHTASYRQLGNPAFVRRIAVVEKRLNREGRYMIPEGRIASIATRIHSGDIIGVTTNVHGLDVSHTAIALWDHGVLRLMHAPNAGSTVQLSETSIADHVTASKSQDGIMVARPR